jgi:hypothetical protein
VKRAAAATLVVLVGTGCADSHSSVRSTREVARVLREAHLNPQRTTITVTLESTNGAAEQAPPLQYAINAPSYEEFRARATYSVEGGRTIVYVYGTEEVAAPFSARPRSHVLVVRNVVAVTGHGTLSPPLRAALARLA